MMIGFFSIEYLEDDSFYNIFYILCVCVCILVH